MLNKLLKEIVVITVGKQAEPIADLLETNKHVNEFNIAKKLELTINQTRNILYKISNYGLISSRREKDKKKGWYTYFWRFEILKCLEFLEGILTKNIGELEVEIESRQKNLFYICERCHIEYGSEDAPLKNFTCDECGDVFTVKNNSKLVRELKKHLEKLKVRLEMVDIEMAKEKIKLGKKKEKELKKEEKLKLEKKAEASAKRRLVREEKARLAGKTLKPVKKKVVKKKVVKKKVVKKKPAVKKKLVKKVIKKVATPKTGVPSNTLKDTRKKTSGKKAVKKVVVKKKPAVKKKTSGKKK